MKLNATLIATFALLLALPGSALAAPKAKMRFTSSVVVASEGSGQATVTVTRAKRTGNAKSFTNMAASVNYSTSAGSAGAGDYTNVSGTLNFAPGDVEESFVVPIAQDTEIEGAETVNLALSAPSRSAVIVNPSTATLTIADDDGPTQIQFSPVSYTVSEAGGNAELTVVRSGDVSVQSTAAVATVDGTATAGSDYSGAATTVTFAPSDLSETISIPITNDSVVGEGGETFSVELSSAANAKFPNNAATTSAGVTILDDDTISGDPELAFSTTAYSGAENGTGIAVTVVRVGPVNREISAAIRSIGGSATDGVDYETLNDLVEFDPGDITQTLSLPLTDDAVDEADERFEVALSAPAGGTLASPSSATLTILDDDQTPIVVETPGEPAPQQSAPVTHVTNNTTTVTNTTITNPFAGQAGQLILGDRIGSCKLSIAAPKSQRIMRAKLVRVKLHAAEACTGSVKSHVKGRKSLRGVKKGAIQTKVVKFALEAGQTKTIKLGFSKRGYSFLKRALGKQKTLSASLLVRSINSSKRTTLNTLRWTAKR